MDPMPPQTRRLWKIHKAGSLSRLRLGEERLASLQAGKVRLRVRAAGLNFADIFACLGLYSATPRGEFVPGLEFSGVIEEVGPDQPAGQSWKLGDRVFGVIRFGAFADLLDAEAAYLRPLPEAWSFEEGASFGVQMLTAWYALLELGGLQSGQTVLLHSAAGGVGLNALRILAHRKAPVIATIGRQAKRAFLKEQSGLRDEQIIVRDRRGFGAQLDKALESLDQPGFDLVLDSVAGPYFWPGYRRLRPAGRLIIYGAADWMPSGKRPNYLKLAWRHLRRPKIDPLQMIADNRSVMGFNLIWLWNQVALLSGAFDRIEAAGLMARPPHVGRTYPFEEAPQALRYLQSGASVGKVVLSV